MPNSDMVQSVLKALDILRAATEAPNGVRLNELAEAMDLKKSTAHNLIRTLCARGFLVKDSANRFLPGVAIQELARLSRTNIALNEATKQLRLLRKAFPKATLTFSELAPNAIHCRLRMSADRPGEVQHPLECLYTPYVSATAVCLQATGSNASEFERTSPSRTRRRPWKISKIFWLKKKRVAKTTTPSTINQPHRRRSLRKFSIASTWKRRPVFSSRSCRSRLSSFARPFAAPLRQHERPVAPAINKVVTTP